MNNRGGFASSVSCRVVVNGLYVVLFGAVKCLSMVSQCMYGGTLFRHVFVSLHPSTPQHSHSPRGNTKKGKKNQKKSLNTNTKKGSVPPSPTTSLLPSNHTYKNQSKVTYRDTSGNVDTEGQTKTPSQGHGEPGVVVGEDQLGNGARTEGDQDGSSQELSESLSELFWCEEGGERMRERNVG